MIPSHMFHENLQSSSFRLSRLFGPLILGIISGLCSFFFIYQVNQIVAEGLTSSGIELRVRHSFVLFLIVVSFILSRRILSHTIIRLSQSVFWAVRKDVISAVLRARYSLVSTMKNEISSSVLNDASALTQASWMIIDFFTSIVLATSCFIYLAYLSLPLFLLTLTTAAIGVIIYIFVSRAVEKSFAVAIDHENQFIDQFNSILQGLKEIKLSPKKGLHIFQNRIFPIADASYRSNTAAYVRMLNSQLTGQFLFYSLIAAVLLFFSHLFHLPWSNVVSFVFTLLFLLGAITTIMGLLPVLLRAKASLKNVAELKQKIGAPDARQENDLAMEMTFEDFKSVIVESLTFTYDEPQNRFVIGPINISIQRGDIAFIYGGNGSGKTTLINCLLRLYTPTGGNVLLNGKTIDSKTLNWYKSAFAAVFSDYYLFKEIMNVKDIDLQKWNYYLELFEISDKVKLHNATLSTTNLSTGQRKRLALIMILLEKRPLLVLDEWAADQDPHFRKKFYTVILSLLVEEGFTILAISHDDRYFKHATKLYRMEEGRLNLEPIEGEFVTHTHHI